MAKLLVTILLVVATFWGTVPMALGVARAQEQLILCSTFPVYLFTRDIMQGRENIVLGLLTDSALGCSHDHALTVAELEHLSRADILVINGLGLETFLPQALRVAKVGLEVVDASATLGDENRHGVQIVLSRNQAKGLKSNFDDTGPNPHVFAAAGTAADMVRNISEGLIQIDPEGAAIYRKNSARLVAELEILATAFQTAGKTLGQPKVMVSHGIFHYMAQEMGLVVVASLEEVDGTQPSAARLTALIRQAKDEKVQAILTDPEGNVSLAQTVGAAAKIPVIVVDLVAAGPQDAPLDYYQKVMLTDLEILIKALSPPAASR